MSDPGLIAEHNWLRSASAPSLLETPRSGFQEAQRQFWQAVSDDTASSAGEFFGELAHELWDDLPGIEPALGYLPLLGQAARFGGALKAARPEAEAAAENGISIGRSGYRSIEEFSDAVLAKYQALYDHHYGEVLEMARKGIIPNTPLAIGGRLDGLARDGIRQFVEDEGVREGSGELIQINRRLPDPDGSGASRFPDIYIPKAGVIFDGSLAPKFASSLQIADFGRFSGGAKTSIVRPSSLPPKDLGGGGSIMGSYGIVPRTPK